MARAVEQVLAQDGILLCEAGTGTGKTISYLLPALLSQKKVIVSTATRALQEQIVQEDLPWLEQSLHTKANVTVMKGLSNYICLRRLNERLAEGGSPDRLAALARLRDFAETSETGDIAELSELREDDPLLAEVTAHSELRIGATCQHYSECFVTRMRQRAEAAQLVVVNHHLFFADLALRGAHPGHVLPDYDAVIFDEAHQLEDIATEFFGTTVSSFRLDRMLSDVERDLERCRAFDDSMGPATVGTLIGEVKRAARRFFDDLRPARTEPLGRHELDVAVLRGPAQSAWIELDTTLEALLALLNSAQGHLPRGRAVEKLTRLTEALELLGRRIAETRAGLAEVVDPQGQRVVWAEYLERGVRLTSSPLDLAATLRSRIFDAVPAVILTSATLTSPSPSRPGTETDPFLFLKRRLGIDPDVHVVEQLALLSPFDFEQRALLYTPHDMPDPGSSQFLVEAAQRIAELIRATRGGAFVLTTSIRSMLGLYEDLRQRLGEYRVSVQGSAPKTELLRSFREEPGSVLVATSSFWEGVDVPGPSLRLVVLEKIPFPVPTDPLVRARAGQIEQEGGNAFREYLVPVACIALKQGFGRLLRTRTDAGVVALLDSRIHRRGYGELLLRCLPPAKRTLSLDEVKSFCAELPQA